MAQTTQVRIGDGNRDCGNITGSFNFYMSDEDTRIMSWLSPLKPNSRHEGVRADRFAGVGNWLLETSEFREWRGGDGGADKAVLFCCGNPGVGKTYLSSLVLDNLCDHARKENIAVAGLYCDFLAQQEQTVANMMGAILKQLVGRGDIPEYIREAFQDGKTELGGRRLLLPDLMGMLRIAIASLPQAFICIDALDECVPKHLLELLKSLKDIVRESPRVRIFLTGRPHVKEDIQRYFNKAVVIPTSPNAGDIRSYLEMKLDGDTDPEAMSDALRADIISVILEKISDIFLLVSLTIDAILGEVTLRQRKTKLEVLTKGNGLSDAYTATLTRMKAQKGNKSTLGLKVLMWVLYSERPLGAEELRHALGVEVGSTDLDVENVPSLRTLVASCLGLVTIEASSSKVRLVHYSLQEYLSSAPTIFYSPHSTIAEVCLTYLNSACVRDISPTLHSAPTAAPMALLEYASYYWAQHTRRGMTENVKVLALKLLDRFDEHISAQLMLLRHNKERISGLYFNVGGGPIGFTGLHGAAFLGIVGIVTAILKMKKWNVNATDSMGSTALTWAAVRGQEEVVKLLLDQEGVNPDQADTSYGRTPLSWAATYGQEGVVKILLERGDVHPGQAATRFGGTPLSWAVTYGNEGVVRMLLERDDVNPNHPGSHYGRTPLWLAAQNGQDGVVKILLEQEDVNPNQADTRDEQTPLSQAAMHGREGVVKMLLERDDVNPDHADTGHRTPLLLAATHGHAGVVKMLLERDDVNPNYPGCHCDRTLLSQAAMYGHAGIVKMLLERDDVNPNHPDRYYRWTPLLWAAQNGHEAIVKMLLERDDVNPDHADTGHRTPLLLAATHGHSGVVKMLLERKYARTATQDNANQTPLSRAPSKGNGRVVEIPLEQDNAKSDSRSR